MNAQFWKNKKFWIIVAVVVVITIIVIVIAKRRKAKLLEQSGQSTSGGTTAGKMVVVKTPASATFPLQYGSRGPEVVKLQMYLNYMNEKNAMGLIPLNEDGIWGTKTDAAFKTIMRASSMNESTYNLTVNAIIK